MRVCGGRAWIPKEWFRAFELLSSVSPRLRLHAYQRVLGFLQPGLPLPNSTNDETYSCNVTGRLKVSGGFDHRGELFGAAPTNKQITVKGILISRISNGKIVEDVESYDALGMLRQIGSAQAGRAAA
jgi:hypothetical protein